MLMNANNMILTTMILMRVCIQMEQVMLSKRLTIEMFI